MSETIQTGGVGSNPAIAKINQLNAISSRNAAVTETERKAFTAPSEKTIAEISKRERIINQFAIPEIFDPAAVTAAEAAEGGRDERI